MANKTQWSSSTGLGDYYDASNWTNGAPTAGDLVVISYGMPTLDNGSIDNMTIDIVSQQTLEASLGLTNVTLGPNLLFEDTGTTNGAAVLASGTVTNDGTLLFDATLGGIFNGFSFDFQNTSDELINNGLITIAHSDGLFLGNGGGGALVNNGTLDDQSARLFLEVPVTGSGVIEVSGAGGQGGALDLTSAIGSGQTIAFGDALSTVTIDVLRINGPSTVKITGFVKGDKIDFPNAFLIANETVDDTNTSSRALTIATSTGTATIQFGGTANYYGTFNTESDDNGGFDLIASVTDAGASLTSDTVVGSDGAVRTVTFSNAKLANLAAPLLAALTPSQTTFIDNGGVVTAGAGFTGLVDDASGAVTATGSGAANETVIAGAGAFDFTSGGGSGTIVTGGGNDFLFLPQGGNWTMTLGSGVDTVVAAAGNDTLTTGPSGALIFLGAGSSSVASSGADTIVGETGGGTIAAVKSNPLIFSLGGPLDFQGGSGAATVVAGQVPALLTGGSGSMLAFTDGDTTYQGASGSDTIVGLYGALTVQAGSGGDVVFGGFAGGNQITSGTSGTLTAYGEGNGDVITAQASATVVAAAGAGGETLTGANSSGTLAFFGGSGVDLLQAGSGAAVLTAGFGGGTLGGGTGGTLFEFKDGLTFGPETITGWNAASDYIQLTGYAVNDSGVLGGASVANGSTTFSLSDGTVITVAGVTDPSTINFYVPFVKE